MSVTDELRSCARRPSSWLLVVAGLLVIAVLGMHAVDHHAVAHHGSSGEPAAEWSGSVHELASEVLASGAEVAAVSTAHDAMGEGLAFACAGMLLGGLFLALRRRVKALTLRALAVGDRVSRPLLGGVLHRVTAPPDLVALGISRI